MKIGVLDMHCGECDIVDFCGNLFGYCICNQDRFATIDMEIYKEYTDKTKTKVFESCQNCQQNYDCDNCDDEDIARDYMCEQIAEHVAAILIKRN